MDLKTTVLLLFFATFAIAENEQCDDNSQWFHRESKMCRPCTKCVLVLKPCRQYLDAKCVDLKELNKEFNKMRLGTIPNKKKEEIPTDSLKENLCNYVAFTIGIFCITMFVLLCLCFFKKSDFGPKPRSPARGTALLNPLHSTEYMKELAHSDDKLAMDVILQRKQQQYTIIFPNDDHNDYRIPGSDNVYGDLPFHIQERPGANLSQAAMSNEKNGEEAGEKLLS